MKSSRKQNGQNEEKFQGLSPVSISTFRDQGSEEAADRENVVRKVREKPEDQKHNKDPLSMRRE